MRNIVSAYVERFLHDRRERLKFGGIVLLLAVIVAGIVFWRLSYVGVAMTNEVYCGQEEHQHDSSCYAEVLTCGMEESAGSAGHTHDSSCYETVTQLVCGLEESAGHINDDSCFDENGNLICAIPESEGHTHTDACYESTQVLICGLEESPATEGHTHDSSCYELVLTCDIPEHTHSIECMMDETADVETYKDWEDTLPDEDDLTGVWTEDVVLIARSQIGYTESEANFQLAEDGETRNGYTRYGAWYGNEYGDWDAMFVSFCLNYAGVSEEEFPFFPYNSGAYAWIVELEEEDLYVDAEDHEPAPGDLIFLNTDDDNKADTVAIVTELVANARGEVTELKLIQGDSDDAVEEYELDIDDASIVGFGILPEQPVEENTLTGADVTDAAAVAEVPAGGVAEAAEEETVPETDSSEPAVEETASSEPEETFEVTYISDEPGAVKVEGPETTDAGGDLLFYVTVDTESGYDVAEITANGEELMPEEITVSEDGGELVYTYLLEDVEENTLVMLSATQVIDGSGSVGVFEKAENYDDDNPDYILTVSEVPTNTKISLDSPHVTLKASDGNEVTDVSLKQSLYYLANGGTEMPVAYLMLDGDEEAENTYVVTAYGSDNEPYDLTAGRLVLDTEKIPVVTVEVWPIQVDLLCFLNEENITSDNEDGYTQTLIGAKTMSVNAQTFTVVGNEGDIISMSTLTGKNELYYGSLENLKDADGTEIPDTVNLTLFDGQAQIVQTSNGYYALQPLDANGNPVEDVSIYMVYDHVYSFDLEVTDVVNEHTEDNGDTYLWLGGDFYIDQYHAQGIDTIGYTRSQNTLTNCGVWVQLGRIREEAINGGTKTFEDYENIDFQGMITEGVSLSGYDSANAASTAESNAPYGIVGPYTATDSRPVTTTIRVTGHVGDEFTTNEAFGTNIVYMVTNEELQTDWINLGSHASDNGYRAWFYWINNYYKLNNHEDQVEYLLIYEDEESGEIRLDLDEMGSQGEGEVDDYWNQVEGLYTKRNSVIKQYMLTNQKDLEEQGVGFADTAGWMEHIQLRMYSTVEEIIDGVEYSGKLELLYNNSTPSISWNINSTAVSFSSSSNPVLQGSEVLEKDNEQESKQYEFGFYINPEYAFDPNYVQITVTVQATGKLTGTDGSVIEYTEDDPLEYNFTLTEAQLREAYDDCPNSEGYDIAINLSEAAKVNVETSDQIILYKIWDDSSNETGARDYVESVSVTLERSKDEVEWESVVDEQGNVVVFKIEKTEDEGNQNTWSTVLTSEDLDLTYTNPDDGNADEETVTAYYQFRIASELAIGGVGEGFAYSYTTSGLTVTNSLTDNTIDISGIKVWLDEDGNEIDNLAGSGLDIPESVTIAVFQDGHFYDLTTATANGGWKFSFQDLPKSNGQAEYVYTLYELDETGVPVADGESILLNNNYYLVEVVSGEEYDENYGGYDYVVVNEYSPFRLDIYKYTGDNVTITYAGAAGSLAESQYYLWRINNETNEQEFASGNPTETGGMIVVSAWSSETSEESVHDSFSPTNEGLIFTSLSNGYTYYLTTETTFNEDSAIELTLTPESVSGGTPLSGAEFIITRTEEDTTYYGKFTVGSDGVWYLTGWIENESEAAALKTGEDGFIHVGDLEAGNYTLVEVRAPDGYNLLDRSIEFTLGDGPISIAIPVENLPAEGLPRTGGTGTVAFTIAGLTLITASAGILGKRKNKRREEGREP